MTTRVVSESVVASSFHRFADLACSTGSARHAHAGTMVAMSEHTERLEDLGKRIASAKEFL